MVEWYIFSSLFSGITDDLANEDIETKQNIFNFIDYKECLISEAVGMSMTLWLPWRSGGTVALWRSVCSIDTSPGHASLHGFLECWCMSFERVVLLWPEIPPSLVGAKSWTEAGCTSEKIYLFEVQFLRLGIPLIDLDPGQQSQRKGCRPGAGGLVSWSLKQPRWELKKEKGDERKEKKKKIPSGNIRASGLDCTVLGWSRCFPHLWAKQMKCSNMSWRQSWQRSMLISVGSLANPTGVKDRQMIVVTSSCSFDCCGVIDQSCIGSENWQPTDHGESSDTKGY